MLKGQVKASDDADQHLFPYLSLAEHEWSAVK